MVSRHSPGRSAGAAAPRLPSRLRAAGPAPPVSPRDTKSWIPGLLRDPIHRAASNLPGPAGGRHPAPGAALGPRARCPAARFLHPGRGGRQTSGGGGGGELRGPPPPRCREGPRRRPGSLLEAAEEGSAPSRKRKGSGRGAPLRGRVPENCSKATAGTPQSVR